MHIDKERKISTFLCTLATSRSRILGARMITGTSIFSLALLCLAVTYTVLLKKYCTLVPLDWILLGKIFLTSFLTNAACYALGLLMGLQENKFFRFFGSIILCAPLLAIIEIKGFGIQMYLLLLLVAIAGFVRAGQKYHSSSL